jgi:uncharacterized protein YbgA (DUF1722 family)
MNQRRRSMKTLADFHSDHEYLLMAHSPSGLRQLGKVVANPEKKKPAAVYAEYLPLLMESLKLKATIKKNTSVLQHLVGRFKKDLDPDEKQELLDVIEEYHRELVPLVVPVTLIKHYVRKYQESCLGRQVYLDPYPAELMLRNHA